MKRYFSKRLYIEGLTRVRTPGIITAVLSFVMATSTPFFSLMSWLADQSDVSFSSLMVVGASDIVSPLLLLLLACPIFVTTSFRFLNKRHSSDFYHALPYSRVSIVLSFLLGILTWIVGISLVSTLGGMLLYGLNPMYVLQIGECLLAWLSYVIGAMVLLGYMLLAVSLSGTKFSNRLLFVLMICIPRISMSMLVECIKTLAPIICETAFPYSILSWTYFLPLSLLSNSLLGGTYLYLNPWMLVYHGIVALALFALGVYFFHKRPSEAAGNPSTGRKAQHFWRLFAILPIALLATSTLLIEWKAERENPVAVVMAALLILFVALVAYYLYELLTEGKIKRQNKAFRVFPFIFVPMVVFGAIALVVSSLAMHREIPGEQIRSVVFRADDSYYTKQWEHYQTEGFAFEDSVILDEVANAYQKTLALYNNGKDTDDLNTDYTIENVSITTKNGKTRTYSLVFTYQSFKNIEAQKGKIEAYRDAYLSLPTKPTVTYLRLYGIATYDLSLYEIFLNEYEKLSKEEQYKIKSDDIENYFTIQVIGSWRGTDYVSTYGIPYAMEETFAAYCDALNSAKWYRDGEEKTSLDLARLVMNEYLAGEPTLSNASVTVEYILGETVKNFEVYGDTLKHNEAQMLTALAEEIVAEREDTSSANFAVINIDAELDGSYEHFTIALTLSPQFVAFLKSYYNLSGN